MTTTTNTNLEKIEKFISYNSFITFTEKAKVDLKIYIDSSDIIYMLLGIKNMISTNRDIDMNLYRDGSTLIYSLIYGGWLNKISLTIPYQEELYKQLDRGYIFKSSANKENAIEFWNHVDHTIGLKEEDFDKPLTFEEYTEKLRPKADELYKANYLLRELSWQRRLKHLLSKDILEFEQPTDDLISLAKSTVFIELYKAYTFLRPDKHSKNNITDALVLTLVHHRLESYREGKILSLPVLYDREGMFQRAIRTAGLGEKFICRFGDSSFNIVTSEEFLEYLALNRNKEKISDLLEKGEFQDLSEYREMFDSIFNKNGSGSQFAREYEQRISSFVESKFLQVCWVNSKEQVHEFIAALINFKDENLRSEESSETLNHEINGILNQLKESVDKYSIFNESYAKISMAQNTVKRVFTSNLKKYRDRKHSFNVATDLSLTRFSMHRDVWEQVQAICNELLFSEKHEANPTLITAIVQNVIDALQNTNRDKLIISLMVFWILEEYGLIIRILDRLNGNYRHYSEAFLHAASIAKEGKTKDDRLKILDILKRINAINDETNFGKNYKTAIAASYIYFQTWSKMYDKSFLSSFEEPVQSENEDIHYLFRKAMDWAKSALKWLNEKDRYLDGEKTYRKEKYYYILNNLIYYVTMGDNDNEFVGLNKRISQLESLEHSNPWFWQYRYHDTLALVYLRKAVMANQLSNKRDFDLFHEEALKRIRLAREWVISIEDQKSYEFLEMHINMTSFR